jgi:flavodoxin I
MKSLVVYDSVYGNTEKIARAIAEAIAASGEIKVLPAGEVNPSELASIDLLIVGSPTHGGRPTPAVQGLLNKVTQPLLKGIDVAVFDTRSQAKLARVFGNAAGRIARHLKRKGAVLVVSPEGFFVTATRGPLKEGELERAGAWARGVLGSKK